MNIQDKFYEAIKNNDIDNVKLLLKNKNFNPYNEDNLAIQLASENGHLDIVKLLLNDERVNHSSNTLAFENQQFDIIKLLLNDERVKNTLKLLYIFFDNKFVI